MLRNISVTNEALCNIKPVIAGFEDCSPGHFFGPAVRNHWLIHYVTSGIGYFEIEGKQYTVPSGSMFVIPPYIETFYADASYDHMVFPGMVYISHPTEYGTLYTKAELKSLAEVCRHYDIPLFLDGARLGYGLMSYDTDLTLPEIAELCDVFYIGGTKVGALCGEAVVFTHNNAPKHFFTMIKQHGALLAKGRLNSVQFDALFTDDLYFKISRHAIDMAEQLKCMFREKGYKFFMDSPTNQQFIILENSKMHELEQKVRFSFWEKYDDTHTVVRFATAWSTTQEQMDALNAII